MKDFNGRLALITGGSSGIGLALAKNLATKGANVWIVARNQIRIQQALEEIRTFKVREDQQIDGLSLDVSRSQVAMPALQDFCVKVGAPDLLINSAGVTHPGKFEDLDLAIFREMMEINYFGALHTIKAVVPEMIERRSGHIVNISSIAGFAGVYGYSAYGASKFALRGLSDYLRTEMRYYGIKVTVVFPGDTDTPQLAGENEYKPLVTKYLSESNAKTMKPEDVANTIIKAVQRNKYIVTPGSDATFLYYAQNFLQNFSYTVLNMMTDSAYRKAEKELLLRKNRY